uniref:Uncharacterized protein n=1 Tax=Aureoumbra lagunensis TaxID=44058 RepID=A0A7S3NIE3_9STRA
MGRKVFLGRRQTSAELTAVFHWGGDDAPQWVTELRGKVLHENKENIVDGGVGKNEDDVEIGESTAIKESGEKVVLKKKKILKKPRVKRKPLFYPWGFKNVEPTVGGVVYGQYLLSHNVTVKPDSQVYPSALRRHREFRTKQKSSNSDLQSTALNDIDAQNYGSPASNHIAGLRIPRYGSVADCFQFAADPI